MHVLDLAPIDGSDPVENHATIERELAAHDAAPRLAAAHPRALEGRPRDAGGGAGGGRGVARAAREEVPVLLTSSATGAGPRRAARARCCERVPLRGARRGAARSRGSPSTRSSGRPPTRGFEVERVEDGRFRVVGEGVDRLVLRYDVDNEEAMAHLERRLKRIGVIQALEDAGFEPGDDVEIGGVEFELDPCR